MGLVGLRHAGAIRQVDGVELRAVADPSADSRNRAADEAVPHFDTLDELIAADRPDGIILATPTTLHAVQGRLCIDASIPVLIEKPLADNLAEGEALVKHAEAANQKLLQTAIGWLQATHVLKKDTRGRRHNLMLTSEYAGEALEEFIAKVKTYL